MATEVHSIPTPPTLLERRSGSRLQFLSDRPNPHLTDGRTQTKDEVARNPRGSFTAPFAFTPLTPILASPVLTPSITATTPLISSTNLNPVQNSGGTVKHRRSRSTLSRLHVTLPEDYFDAQSHPSSVTAPTIPISSSGPGQPSGSSPSSSLLKDFIILDGVPIARTPSPTGDITPQEIDFPTVSPQASVAPKLPRSRTKSARASFMLGSDDEDDAPRQQQKREAAANAKKLERYDDLRRYHALMELLKTEAKYLQDLRILINVCATCCSV